MKRLLLITSFIIGSHLCHGAADLSSAGVAFRSRSMPDVPSVQQEEDGTFKLKKQIPKIGCSRVESMKRLAMKYYHGGDIDTAIKWLSEVALCGDTEAMNFLGVYHARMGDTDKAKELFFKAAQLGDPKAEYNLGCLCEQEKDIEQAKQKKNLEKIKQLHAQAKKHYINVADLYPTAKNNLARLLYKKGKKEEEIMKLLKEAAEEGCAEAMFNFGWLFEQRNKVAKRWYESTAYKAEQNSDVIVAKKWYESAAQKGDKDAMFVLGCLCEEEGNPLQARKWYKKASDKGHEDAHEKLKISGSLHTLMNVVHLPKNRSLSFMKGDE